MRLRLIQGGALLLGLLACQPLAPARAEAVLPVGRWLTQDHDGVIEIYPCEMALCGRIVGMDAPRRPDGNLSRDVAGHPQCGLAILRVVETDQGRWEGRITDPDSGSIWRCALWLDGEGRLNLRGYVLVPALGQTQRWTRYGGGLGADCAMKDAK